MTAPTRDEVIQMAEKCGFWKEHTSDFTWTANSQDLERLVAAAYARGVASESKRSDALAATIAELRDLVTTEGETKAGFVARVRAVLGEDPDVRVVRVAAAAYTKGQEDMRERCANTVDKIVTDRNPTTEQRLALQIASEAIRAIPIQKGCEE